MRDPENHPPAPRWREAAGVITSNPRAGSIMRNVAVCGAGFPALHPHASTFGAVAIHGVPARVGVLERPDPAFDAADPGNARKVLVRVRAFSCNYRDRAQIYKLARFGAAADFYVLGSEFAGEV